MEFVKYSVENGQLNGLHHRFIQPPQIAYFVTTVDKLGNVNVHSGHYGNPVLPITSFRLRFLIFMWERMSGIRTKMNGKTA